MTACYSVLSRPSSTVSRIGAVVSVRSYSVSRAPSIPLGVIVSVRMCASSSYFLGHELPGQESWIGIFLVPNF